MSETVYRYSKHVEYAENLFNDLISSFPTLKHVVVIDEETIDLYFEGPLNQPESDALQAFITAWVNPPPPIHTRVSHTLTVSLEGATDFNDIEVAIDYAYTLLPTQVTIIVYPGIYILTRTMNLPNGLILVSDGAATTSQLIYSAQGQAVVTMSGNAYLEGFTVVGDLTRGMIGIQHEGSGPPGSCTVNRCNIVGVDIGIQSSNGPNSIQFIHGQIGGMHVNHVKTGVKAINGGIIHLIQAAIVGLTTRMLYAVHCTGINSGTTGAPWPSTVNISTCRLFNANVGVLIEEGLIECRSSEISACATGAAVQYAGTYRSLFNDVSFANNDTWDFDVQTTAASNSTIILQGCLMDRNKINNPNFVYLLWQFMSNVPYQTRHIMTGTINFGDHITPTRLLVGKGESSYGAMAVLSNSNGTTGTWIDNTEKVMTETPFDIWQSVALGNAIYLGQEDESFAGARIKIVTPNGGGGQWQYWNGIEWVPCKIMTVSAEPPFTNYGMQTFSNPPGTFYIFFGRFSGWTKISLAGRQPMYYVRHIITDPSTTMATIKSISPIMNSTLIEQDGYTLRFGKARTAKLHGFVAKNSYMYQYFRHGYDDYFATTCILPSELDTSYPVKLSWSWFCPEQGANNTSGTVKWSVRYAAVPIGSRISLTADNWLDSDHDKINTMTTNYTQNDHDNVHMQTVTELDLSNSKPGSDLLIFKITRHGTDPEDSHSKSLHLLNCYMKYLTFLDGTAIEEMS